MECKAEDYYDIPYELLPIPNFAGRPTSEISAISMLDGLLVFPDFSPSIFDTDSDVDSTWMAQCPAKSPQLHTQAQPVTPKTTGIKVTSPSSDCAQQNTRSWSVGPTTEIPRSQKKAFTAPPGAIRLPDFAPQPPRRALSVDLGQSKTVKGRGECKKNNVEDLLVTKSALRETWYSSQRPLLHLPNVDEHGIVAQAGGALQSSSLISVKARVGRRLGYKKLVKLDTTLTKFDAKKSPVSVMNTPRELYGVSELEMAWTRPCCQLVERNSLVRTSSETPRLPQQPTCSQRFDMQGFETLQHDDDVASKHTEEQRPLYLPGPVVLEKHPVVLRKDSVATMDMFDGGLELQAKRFSDLTTIDGIVSYFEDLGVMEESPDDCLDKYWLDEGPEQRASTRSERASIVSIMSIVEPMAASPLGLWSASSVPSDRETTNVTGIQSKFSFSSTLSSASLCRRGTPMGKRLRWRKLLTPGVSGSAFLKSGGS